MNEAGSTDHLWSCVLHEVAKQFSLASINGQGLVVDKAKDIVDKEYVRFKLEDGFFLAAVRFNPVGGAYEVCINNNGQLYIYNFSHNLSEIMEGLTRLLSSRENPD